jgi:hypothetical protein
MSNIGFPDLWTVKWSIAEAKKMQIIAENLLMQAGIRKYKPESNNTNTRLLYEL